MSGEKEWAIGSPITPRIVLVALMFKSDTLTDQIGNKLICDLETFLPGASIGISDEHNPSQEHH
tara:strand:+ start:1639 stop:1830 length:192 start_codon:yes stop_codon:yes gene_type:complete